MSNQGDDPGRPQYLRRSCASFSFRRPCPRLLTRDASASSASTPSRRRSSPAARHGADPTAAWRTSESTAFRIERAVSQQAHRGTKVWWECQKCEKYLTGPMRTGLGEAWWSRVCEHWQAEESEEQLCAANNLAECRRRDGQYAEAERTQRELLGVLRRVQGEEHPDTLTRANNLALSLSDQGKTNLIRHVSSNWCV